MFSDFKRRGFRWKDTKIEASKRLDGMILIMALAMDWCVQAGQYDARCNPPAAEKKARAQADPSACSGRSQPLEHPQSLSQRHVRVQARPAPSPPARCQRTASA